MGDKDLLKVALVGGGISYAMSTGGDAIIANWSAIVAYIAQLLEMVI